MLTTTITVIIIRHCCWNSRRVQQIRDFIHEIRTDELTSGAEPVSSSTWLLFCRVPHGCFLFSNAYNVYALLDCEK